ncbi:hypothetical protein ACQKNX_04880 [Lysinibacillus sp. NPDC093712]|uniref:hypothetical protein n=1 Tax=Lysinibacillus sp. NPDC093712 TaxID=3390579 RepID=UPI003D03EC05
MRNITDSHKCFNCDTGFKWQAIVRHASKSEMNGYMVSGQQASVAFVESNKIQVKVNCSKCGENNLFNYEIE